MPRAFREEHALSAYSRYHGGGAIKGSRVYRAGGECSCGEKFGLRADRHNMDRADVIDAHKDHVVAAWEATERGRTQKIAREYQASEARRLADERGRSR